MTAKYVKKSHINKSIEKSEHSLNKFVGDGFQRIYVHWHA